MLRTRTNYDIQCIKCDLRGNHLKTYKNGERAAQILKVSPSPIYDCMNGKRKTAYGFKWKRGFNLEED